MRLLNSSTLQLAEFAGSATPEYVILSHTWGEEEMSFQGIQDLNSRDQKGFAKVKNFCAQAARDGFEWVWIDTWCIDKSSSAELSEASSQLSKLRLDFQVVLENIDMLAERMQNMVSVATSIISIEENK